MLPKFSQTLFKRTKDEYMKLDVEYEKMKKSNKCNSKRTRDSIQKKSCEMSKMKQQRKKHFDFIRNK